MKDEGTRQGIHGTPDVCLRYMSWWGLGAESRSVKVKVKYNPLKKKECCTHMVYMLHPKTCPHVCVKEPICTYPVLRGTAIIKIYI